MVHSVIFVFLKNLATTKTRTTQCIIKWNTIFIY